MESKVTLEIEATTPDGAPEQAVRIVTENSRTLTFGVSRFEEEQITDSLGSTARISQPGTQKAGGERPLRESDVSSCEAVS